jgi:hypothetical protein
MTFFNKIRIPTFLGLGLILLGTGVGIYLSNQNQNIATVAAPDEASQNILITNLEDDSITISWQTDNPAVGYVSYGLKSVDEQNALDDRDTSVPTPQTLHYVTIKDLTPQTIYKYRVVSGRLNNQPIAEFVTASPTKKQNNLKPIIGSVLDGNTPLKEGVAYLFIPGMTPQSALIKDLGSFILPVSFARKEDLTDVFNLTQETAKIEIKSSDKRRGSIHFKVDLKSQEGKIVGPIKLGQDLDLTKTLGVSTSKFDLNKDGLINSSDYAEILKNFGKSPKNKLTDLNSDNTVDKKDLTIISEEIKSSRR